MIVYKATIRKWIDDSISIVKVEKVNWKKIHKLRKNNEII
jgi:hypothetical protein